jgi:hypothetical protein
MDRACLIPCISLLDHQLRGSLFERVAVGFHAVLGINTTNETLRDAFPTPMCCHNSSRSKSRTFLEDEIWAMSPQECGPSSDTAEHSRLINILVHVPRLLEQQRKLQVTNSHNARHTLIYHVEKYLATTRKWRLRWLEVNHSECDASYPLLGLTQCETFSKVLSCSMRQATDVCLHNAVVLMLMSILWSLKSGPESLRTPSRTTKWRLLSLIKSRF